MAEVSIIIPFYNTPEQFIREAIESVFVQSYENWEILLVDDGSKTGCTETAKHYAQSYPDKIRYLEHTEHQNRGASATRNLGIRNAKGDYIAFLDSDDVWLPQKLEQQLSIMQTNPKPAMVYGKTLYWWSWSKNCEMPFHDRIQEHGITPNVLIDPPLLLKLFLKGKTAIPPTSSVIVRREIIERIKGFEEKIRGDTQNPYDDQAFYSKLCLEFPVFVSSECWDKYRQHSESLCGIAEREGQIQVSHLYYLKWLNEYFLQRGFQGTAIWRTLQWEIWLRRHWELGRRIKRAQRFLGRLKGNYPLCMKN